MFEEDKEVMPHRKRTNSNKSSSDKKANHKHDYETVLYCQHCGEKYSFLKEKEHYCLAQRCKICGKIALRGAGSFFISEPSERGFNRILSNQEIREKYSYLPLVDGGVI